MPTGPRPRTLIAIDPGDVYVGAAVFDQKKDYDPWSPPLQDYCIEDWQCVAAMEYHPDQFADDLAESIIAGDYDYVVFERFRLYGDKANQQTGSEFQTSQLIGVIKFLVRNHNRHAAAHFEVEQQGGVLTCELENGTCQTRREVRHVTLVGQMADIKNPTRGILNTRGIKSIARPIARRDYNNRDHIVDAELHGWHHILNGMYADS